MKGSSQGLRRICAALAVTAMIGLTLSGTAFADNGDTVVFADANLEAVLLSLPGADADASGTLTEGEMAALEGGLVLKNSGISDITGLQYATGIEWLDLSGNMIRDLLPLGALTLTRLDVTNNYLDITKDSGDMAVIGTLEATGCEVIYTPQASIPVSGISLDRDSADMCPGDVVTLTAAVSPGDAANPAVAWASDNEAAVTVTGGTITAVAVGTANITATTQDGGFVAECAVRVKPDKLSSDIYTIDGAYVRNVAPTTITNVFVTNFDNDSTDLRLYDAKGALYKKGKLSTGMTVKLFVGNVLRDELTVILDGDTDGNGDIDIMDYTATRLHILDLKDLSGAYAAAADVNHDGAVDILDYTGIRLDILDLKAISDTLPDLPEVTDPRIRAFLDLALAQQGNPYIWGTEGPDSFDCSGFVYYCLTQAGYSVGRSTADTYSRKANWQYVDRDELQPGDLMFYFSDEPNDGDHIGHIGIYLGNGYHIHASSSYGYVVICRVEGWYDTMLSHGRRVFY